MLNYLKFFKYVKPYKLQLFCSVILTIIFSSANVFFLPLARDIITELSNNNFIHFINQIINTIILWGVRLTAQYAQKYLMSWVSFRIVIDIQLTLYRKLMSCSQHFHTKWKLGELLTRLYSDTENIQRAIMISFWEIIPQTTTFLAVLGYLFYLNWFLTLFTLIAVPVFIVLISYFSKLIKKVSAQAQKKTSDITHIVYESLSNIKLVQSCAMEEKEIQKLKSESLKGFKINLKGTQFECTLEPIVAFLHFAVIATVVLLGGYQVSIGYLPKAELAAFFTGIFLIIDPVQALSKVFYTIQQSSVSVDRVQEILNEPILIRNHKNAIKHKINGDIKFNNISFYYNKSNGNVLNNFSLSVKKGEVIAIVGLSGAGKTTLINLIPRFYDPTIGDIIIDNIPLTEIELESLRTQIGIVPQEDIIFRGTIAENIRYGKPNASNDEIIAAAKKANAWEFISKFKDGLFTKTGDRGQRLSGGQKQRISIARALLKNPKILILDEATSSLDTKSEQLIQEALETLIKNRTTFVIAHRLSTIQNASKIIVLENGSIKETGTHKELITHKGLYSKLYNLQFKQQSQK
ncbi:ABC transporter ATP-binding protein [Candidatus Marinamargulisbacteria bacterium SCGC AG-410-N11]|nr:ABC transporter ATP-binding protein [Candidatus Marinamargulisbacteria bacterium SCGC AG-410-N11]